MTIWGVELHRAVHSAEKAKRSQRDYRKLYTTWLFDTLPVYTLLIERCGIFITLKCFKQARMDAHLAVEVLESLELKVC